MEQYTKVFDDSNPLWTPTPEYNRVFIGCQRSYFNHLLLTRGHIFLNEVYDALGIERTAAGQQVGWFFEEGTDNFLDIKIEESEDEKVFTLTFNVQGPIADKLPA